MRRDLNETWQLLAQRGFAPPYGEDGQPQMPDGMPHPDDATMGLEFFRTLLQDEDLSSLTMPRLYLARSEFLRVRWQNSDLSESRCCWNDFRDCDFRDACLAGADLRASNFSGCDFERADLSEADLRHARFENCRFDRATLQGAILSRGQNLKASLAGVDWREKGPLPPGG